MPKVSVIIPVYRVEKYIKTCAISLFEQTLDDMEYIFVDDKSPDNSITILNEIIEKYPKRKPQVKILHHLQNKGLPLARQSGLEEASGDYIIHCDSDDWVDLNLYEKMYNMAIANQADIIRCGFVREYGANVIACELLGAEDYKDKHKLLTKLFCGYDFASLCDKLINRNLYSNIKLYPKLNMWEDAPLTTQLIFNSTKVLYIEGPVYHYRVQPKSIAHTKDVNAALIRCRQSCMNITLIETFLKNNHSLDEYRDSLDCMKRRAKQQIAPYTMNFEIYKEWLETYKEINWRIFLNKKLSVLGKVSHLITLLRLYPILSRYIRI